MSMFVVKNPPFFFDLAIRLPNDLLAANATFCTHFFMIEMFIYPITQVFIYNYIIYVTRGKSKKAER